MAFDRALTSLQSVEEKLRRFLGLAGNIGATFKADVAPVIIAGNLNDPGVAAFRGRHWAWVSDPFNGVPAVATAGLKFGSDVIVTRLEVCYTAFQAARTQVYLFPPQLEASAPSVACTRVCGTWIDQRQFSVDNPPLLDSGAAVLAGSAVNYTIANRIAIFSQQNISAQWTDLGGGMHCPAGSALYFNCGWGAGQEATFAVYGRMF